MADPLDPVQAAEEALAKALETDATDRFNTAVKFALLGIGYALLAIKDRLDPPKE